MAVQQVSAADRIISALMHACHVLYYYHYNMYCIYIAGCNDRMNLTTSCLQTLINQPDYKCSAFRLSHLRTVLPDCIAFREQNVHCLMLTCGRQAEQYSSHSLAHVQTCNPGINDNIVTQSAAMLLQAGAAALAKLVLHSANLWLQLRANLLLSGALADLPQTSRPGLHVHPPHR